jgi:cyclopropane fatty-acyl-phospholipid synthase-like methyltransferase
LIFFAILILDLSNTNRYNKISCIEMAEHVGVKNFQAFLQQVRELLHDDGLFLLQIAGLRRAFQVCPSCLLMCS